MNTGQTHGTESQLHTDGKVTIWSSSQGHFAVRDLTAMVLGSPVSKVKVIPMEIGGGFGGKMPIYLEPVAALLSKKTGHPVKLMMRVSGNSRESGLQQFDEYLNVKAVWIKTA
jgi:CO/xanthine dehydrogenase Mo-binding subunit